MGTQLDDLIRLQNITMRRYQTEIRTLTSEIDANDTEQSLSLRRDACLQGISDTITGMQRSLHLHEQTCDQEIQEKLKNINTHSSDSEIFNMFKTIAEEFKVQGCISIGELKLFKAIARR